MHVRHRRLAVGIGLAALLLAAAPAAAKTGEPTTRASKDCVRTALAREAASWVCLGGRLATVDENGRTKVERVGTRTATARQQGGAMEADDYDRWCENRDICHRRLGEGHYISETKGNYFYGWMTPEGVTSGSFDIVIRTNHGNRLENSNEYYGEVNGHYTPDGVPQFELVPLETERFNCYGGSDDGCYFP